jgi:hypothetical protein
VAVQRFKVALNNARFPLLSTKAQQAVFVPGLDSAPRTPRIFMGADESIDHNLAQVIYSENVMPSSEGIRSVGYSQLIAPTVNGDFDSIFALRDAAENTVLYSPAGGQNYVYDTVAGAWTADPIEDVFAKTLHADSVPATSRVTYAYVDGKTFVCFSRLKSNEGSPTDMSIMFWDGASLTPAGSLIATPPFPVGEIDGIASSNGFLLIWSELSVAWAPFNGTAFDFAPYLNGNFTGAGAQVPEDIQGNIRAIVTMAGGFAMFTDRNAVGASYYSQSLASPWVFREIGDAGGLESYEQATVEGTLSSVYAYTTVGFQRISLNSAESVLPDISDFVANRKIERYRYDLRELYEAAVTLDFFTKITNIANRYVVISYGTFPKIFSYAIVYDLALKRWGKLRMVHRDCFYYAYGVRTADLTYAMLGDVPYDHPDLTTYDATTQQSNAFTAAQHGLAFLKETGEVIVADWSDGERDTEDTAVAIIGRVQLTRAANTQLNRATVAGLVSGSIYVQPSYDGYNLFPAEEMTEVASAGALAVKGCLIDCMNFNLVVHGTFALSTIILEATDSGKF